MTTRRSSAGMSIVEVMVLAAVTLVLVGLLAQIFIVATRRTEDSRVRVDLQQNGLSVLRSLERDLALTSVQSLTVFDGTPYALALTRISHWNANPGVNWEKKQMIYVFDKSEKTLTFETYPPKAPAFADELTEFTPYRPTPGELLAVATTQGGQERILSSSIEEFRLTDRNGSTTQFQTMPLILEMKFRRKLSTSERYADFSVERRLYLRNGS